MAAACSVVWALGVSAAPTGGTVVLMGIDAEDGGVDGHGPIDSYEQVVQSILGGVTNGGSGILVVGGAGTDTQAFWDQVSADLALPVTNSDGPDVATHNFSGYAMIAVVSDETNTPSGGLTQAEHDALSARQGDVAAFVNSGGGLLGFTSDFPNPYAYVAGLGAITATMTAGYSDIDPTPEGTAVGITDALDVIAWHQVYDTYPAFLQPLAYVAGTTQVAALGGNNLTLPPDGDSRGCTITGTPGDDVLVGTPGDDIICGLAGDDRLEGRRGNDVIYGDDGDDRGFGGPGDDHLEGGAGNDHLEGGEGNDTLLGQDGDDRLEGRSSDDLLRGGAGNDTLLGGTEADRLEGEEGDDALDGGTQYDKCNGGSDTDTAVECEEVSLVP
jgi:Ca2+-binding RTX toxin-like protein